MHACRALTELSTTTVDARLLTNEACAFTVVQQAPSAATVRTAMVCTLALAKRRMYGSATPEKAVLRGAGLKLMAVSCLRRKSRSSLATSARRVVRMARMVIGTAVQTAPQVGGLEASSLTEARVRPVTKTELT